MTDDQVHLEAIVADLLDAMQTGDPVATQLTLADTNALDTPDDARAVIITMGEMLLKVIRERIGDDDPSLVRRYIDTLVGARPTAESRIPGSHLATG